MAALLLRFGAATACTLSDSQHSLQVANVMYPSSVSGTVKGAHEGPASIPSSPKSVMGPPIAHRHGLGGLAFVSIDGLLLFIAWVGREQANVIAAVVDARGAGPMPVEGGRRAATAATPRGPIRLDDAELRATEEKRWHDGGHLGYLLSPDLESWRQARCA